MLSHTDGISDLTGRTLSSAVFFIGLLVCGISIARNAERLRQRYVRYLARHPRQARFAIDAEWAKSTSYTAYIKGFGVFVLVMAAISFWALGLNLSEMIGVK
jgi:predicted PurR-regulated permease PerM